MFLDQLFPLVFEKLDRDHIIGAVRALIKGCEALKTPRYNTVINYNEAVVSGPVQYFN